MDQTIARTGTVNGRLWGHAVNDWAKRQEATLDPVFEEVLKRTQVGVGTRYLDLGCGAGKAAAMAIARGATVTGLDASEQMLQIARSRAPQAVFDQADLEDLPYDDAAFDVVTAFNAIQYAATPSNALHEAGRVTTPSGTVAVVTWGQPDGMEAAQLLAALKPLLPPPPPGAPGPFALSDEERLRDFAREGGLDALDVFDVESPWNYPDEKTALSGLRSSGVACKAIEHSGKDRVDAAHAAALAPFRRQDGSFVIGASFRVLLARRSAL